MSVRTKSGQWAETPIASRFWSRVRKTDTCWLWTGAKTAGATGYGQVWFDGRNRIASRVAYELTYGAIPDGMWVLHHCDVRECVRPAHLFLGTNKDNQIDAARKGRCKLQRHPETVRGERNPSSLLTDEKVVWIRRVARTGSLRAEDVATLLGLAKTTVQQAANGDRWSHVAEPPCSFKARAALRGEEDK